MCIFTYSQKTSCSLVNLRLQKSSLGISAPLMMSGTQKRSFGAFEKLVSMEF